MILLTIDLMSGVYLTLHVNSTLLCVMTLSPWEIRHQNVIVAL